MNLLSQRGKISLITLFTHLGSLLFFPLVSSKNVTKPPLKIVTKQLSIKKEPTRTPPLKKALPMAPFQKAKPPIKPLKKEKEKGKPSKKKELKKAPCKKPVPPIPLQQTPPLCSPPPLLKTSLPFSTLLSQFFQQNLCLPEKGDVKLTITVQANGTIGKIEVKMFESKRNLSYLIETLQELSLPLSGEGKDVVFTVLFSSS